MIAERLAEVRARIESAAKGAGRSAQDVELIIVTKNHPAELVAELVDLGERTFGENRDQEAAAKSIRLRELRPAVQANWHFVGQLQSNKVRSVLGYAKCIHSVDRLSLVKELQKQLAKLDLEVECFIELNLTSDPGRGGVDPSELLPLAEQVLAVDRIKLQGVMAVAGLGVDPRQDFERAIEASGRLQTLAPKARYLSMGMSDDFEIAIALGATHIRVGSAITGPRPVLT